MGGLQRGGRGVYAGISRLRGGRVEDGGLERGVEGNKRRDRLDYDRFNNIQDEDESTDYKMTSVSVSVIV